MKEWWTRSEMIDAGLPGLGSNAAISRTAKQNDWKGQPDKCRKRQGKGGGQEIHFSLLPEAAQIALRAAEATTATVDIEVKREAAVYEIDRTLNALQQEERDARLAILAMVDRYAKAGGHSYRQAAQAITDAYNNGIMPVDEWIKDAIPTVSRTSLFRWKKARDEGDFETLSGTKRGQRAKTGILDTAKNGEVKTYILGLIAKMPQLGASPIRKSVIKQFGADLEMIDEQTGEISFKPVPPLRTFQHVLKGWRGDYANELLRLTNPDAYKGSKRFVMAGGASANITRLNQLWEIDASPADVMTKDGRWHIYACIDVWSRRTRILVTQTPRAHAVGLLVRDAIREWGLPEAIKTDNGSDFIAKQTKRFFRSLDIEHVISPPFSPEKKPHVERVIGTYQHSFTRVLPGFIGHSVADRSVIESRKRFSARLGTKDEEIFEVDLTSKELQDYSTRWCEEIYAHEPHSGLNGVTPFERAASYRGTIHQVDEQALDVLLAPIASGDGIRQVTKSGIRINNEHYLIGSVLPGESVFCRMDPHDLGKVWVYDEDGEVFLGHAVAPAIAGLDPVKTIQEVRKTQKAMEDEAIQPIRKAMRKIGPRDVLHAVLESEKADKVVAFPKHKSTVTTPALDAAKATITEIKPGEVDSQLQEQMDAIAADLGVTDQPKPKAPEAPEAPAATVKPLKSETQFDRYRRAKGLEKRVTDGLPVTENDQRWLVSYRASQEFKSMQEFAADFGEEAMR